MIKREESIVRFERLRSARDGFYAQALALYAQSFPLHEQRTPAAQAAALGDGDYHFDLILEGEALAGLLLYWDTKDFLYVEHFCVDPAMRNQGHGQRALKALAERGKTIILEIDPPVDEISRRRQGFYRRLHYQVNAFHHVHPPYREDCAGHELVLLSHPSALSRSEYDRFNLYLQKVVMKH